MNIDPSTTGSVALELAGPLTVRYRSYVPVILVNVPVREVTQPALPLQGGGRMTSLLAPLFCDWLCRESGEVPS